MDTLGSGLINASYKVLVNALGHKGNHRRRRLSGGDKGGVKGHIRRNLILGQTLYPVALPSAADIPVAHIVHKFLKSSCHLGYAVISQIVVYRFYHRVKL